MGANGASALIDVAKDMRLRLVEDTFEVPPYTLLLLGPFRQSDMFRNTSQPFAEAALQLSPHPSITGA